MERGARYGISDGQNAIRACTAILAAVLLSLGPGLARLDGLIYPPNGLYSDLTITHWPAFEYFRDAVRAYGDIPLWRTSILSGTPFAADPVVAVWYPPNWLSLLLALEWFFKLIFLVHLFAGGWGMMRLARSFGVGWIGATASGIAYAIAPQAIGHMGAGHVTLVEAWAWIPFVVWGARRSERKWSGALASGLALGLCVLADARVAVYAAVAAAVYLLISPSGPFFHRALRLMLVLFVAAWASAAAWAPAIGLASESTRASLSLQEAGTFSLPPEYLIGVLLASRGDVEGTTYVGLTALALAIAGVRAAWLGQRRTGVWLLILASFGIVAALGVNTPVYTLLYRLPGFSLLRVPSRAWLLLTFAAILACGFGVDWLARRAEKGLSRKWRLVSLLVGSFALLFGMGGALIASGQAGAERVVLSLIGLAIFLPLILALVAGRLSGRLGSSRFGALVLASITLELAWVGWGNYRVVSEDAVFADGSEVAAQIESASAPFASLRGTSSEAFYRVYSPSYSVPQHVAQRYGLELAGGISPLQLERTVQFMQRATGVGEWGYSVTVPAFEGLKSDEELRTLLSDIVPDPALLGVLNVKYILAHFPIAHSDLIELARSHQVIIYENTRVLPKAWVVGRVTTVRDQAEALDWLPARDLHREAVVEGGPTLDVSLGTGEAQVVEREPDRMVVTANGPGLLVIGEVFEPNWRASIDGVTTPIYPVNGILRGVYLPEGPHGIEFVYDPAIVKAAVAASGTGWVSLLVAWLAVTRRQRRSPA